MSGVPTHLDADPAVRMAALAELRHRCPVAPPAAVGSPWLAVSHEAVETVFREIYNFGGSAGSTGLDEDDTSIAGILEPRHGQIRRIINAVVAFHKSQQIEPFLVELSIRLVDEYATASADVGPEGVDVMPIAVEPVPPNAMARLVGFPTEDAARYYAWADQVGAAFAAAAAESRSISMAEAVPEFTQYVDDRIAERLAMPETDWPQDALTRFLTTEIEGVRLSPRAIRVQILFMIGAGSETTRNLIGSALYRLALAPDLYARVRADRSLIDGVVEETLRIDAPAQFLVRRCLADTALVGQDLHEGEHVMISLSSANWDEVVFPSPDRFDIERDTVRQHVAFGSGPHICPGASLARLEARSLLNAFADRFDHIELGAEYSFDHAAHGMLHGPRTLRLVVREAGAGYARELDSRIAIVTGAGRGVGRGIALALANAGAGVAAVDVDERGATETASTITDSGGEAAAFTCDVSDRDLVNEMVSRVVEQFGSLAVLVNNAQALRAEVSLVDHTVEDVALAIDSGFWGTLHCMQAAFPHLRDSRGGRVVNLGSSAGTQGQAGLAGYAAAKEAIRGLSRVAAREWGEFGITVNVICPSAVSPGMQAWAQQHPELHAEFLAKRPIRRDGDAFADIGPLVVFLAGPGAGFVTGETIMVNGGSALRP